MSENALYNGERVKIGTCQDMYYLRYEQRSQVVPVPGSVDPVKDAAELRFRFPWPSEDHIAPGFEECGGGYKAVHVPGFVAPGDVEHGKVQFIAQIGYNVCLPCPESSAYEPPTQHGALRLIVPDTEDVVTIHVHRNGFKGSVLLVAQRFVPDVGFVPILQCGGCGNK